MMLDGTLLLCDQVPFITGLEWFTHRLFPSDFSTGELYVEFPSHSY